MGLETVHAAALEQLHKRMTIEQFTRAAMALTAKKPIRSRRRDKPFDETVTGFHQ